MEIKGVYMKLVKNKEIIDIERTCYEIAKAGFKVDEINESVSEAIAALTEASESIMMDTFWDLINIMITYIEKYGDREGIQRFIHNMTSNHVGDGYNTTRYTAISFVNIYNNLVIKAWNNKDFLSKCNNLTDDRTLNIVDTLPLLGRDDYNAILEGTAHYDFDITERYIRNLLRDSLQDRFIKDCMSEFPMAGSGEL